ncbi:60S acidic ribosomal protein P2-A [Candida viswanathii]|uniref:60S acidic ribosomal protein P2-A n=1 Tax=Candida viswanathii TaxID=5486 RepID=A0A367YMX2_9ASCO|nr:60S acidic ribosomal protein P2-A [Candida viswanathii]
MSFTMLHNQKMKYLAAYLLLVNAGNATPSAADVKAVLSAADIEIEDDKLEKLISELEGKNVEELIAEGNEKLSSVPTGAPAGGAASAGAAAGEAAAEEEAAEEEKEESDEDMGFGLFD